MAKINPYCVTLFPWLKENGFNNLGGMTGQDYPALKAAVMIVGLWVSCDGHSKKYAATAFRHCVESMQPCFRNLAYHAIAHVADWSHRDELWQEADLERLENPGVCNYEPGGRLR